MFLNLHVRGNECGSMIQENEPAPPDTNQEINESEEVDKSLKSFKVEIGGNLIGNKDLGGKEENEGKEK